MCIRDRDAGGFVYTDGSAPTHLYSELKVIERAIDFAATELALHHCKTFVIASDHGASRLAVLQKQEEKYETDTKGEPLFTRSDAVDASWRFFNPVLKYWQEHPDAPLYGCLLYTSRCV